MLQFVTNRLRAFKYAFFGLLDLFTNHDPIKVQLLAIAVALGTAWYLDFVLWKWIAFILCIGFTLAAEALNTAVEYVVDLVSPEYHELAGKAKDVAAAGVFIAAFTALVVYLLLVWDSLGGLL